jgi:hypothetical protein
MFDQEFVKQFAGPGSNAVMATIPGLRIAPRLIGHEQAGEYTGVSVEAMSAHVRASDAHGRRCHIAYRDTAGPLRLVVAATWVPQGRELEDDGFQAAVSRRAVRRRPW